MNAKIIFSLLIVLLIAFPVSVFLFLVKSIEYLFSKLNSEQKPAGREWAV
ncbi:MAG: hypothetical protein IPM42_13520 [Saprospiraceae bacterium]|nr:hypothetical protein [Saprospiraceae bacterium]